MKINPNLSFLRDQYTQKRVIVLQGGTRSGKTYSAIQFLIELCFKYPNAGMVITIARATYPSLRGSVLRDFTDILSGFDAYNPDHHNKTESTYTLNGNLVEFISLDQPQKVRGRKRDILFVNEANEITLEGWNQLLFRTTGFTILDFNPSDPMHWIYDDVQTREDATTLITTYKDNPHLPDVVIAEIERFKEIDPDYWKVYGEGQRSAGRKGQIFTHFQKVDFIDWEECSSITIGLDFGFTNDPTAVVKLGRKNDRRYIQELIYEKGLTIELLAERLRSAGVTNQDTLVCDSAEPRSIAELRKYGFNAIGVKKHKDSVRHGINALKALSIFVTANSRNVWEEVVWYAWEMDKDDKPKSPERPIDAFNHCFTGDTLITTAMGNVPIKDVKEGDLVLTSQGWNRVLKKWNNGEKSVRKYWMRFGTGFVSLTCTPDHKVKTGNGWTEIQNIKQGETLTLANPSMVRITIYTLMKDIILKAISVCILWFGSILRGRFQKATTFTTSMVTPQITELKTLTSLALHYICDLRARGVLRTILIGLRTSNKKAMRPPKIGTKANTAESGTGFNGKKLLAILRRLRENVMNAERPTKQSTLKDQNSAIKTVKLKHFVSEDAGKAEVFDLTVENNHQYFANGVLVHNCMDAIRYANSVTPRPFFV